jgi:Zn-dependent protease with chaperone function
MPASLQEFGRKPARLGSRAAPPSDFLAALAGRGAAEAPLKTFFSTHPGIEERVKEQERLLGGVSGPGQRNPDRFAQAVAAR